MSIVIRSDQLMGNPPKAAPYAPGRQLYRANFNDGNKASLAGEVTAGGTGLVVAPWEGGANNFAVQSSTVVRGAATGSINVGLPLLGVGALMEWDVVALPANAPLYLDLFASTIGGSPDVYRLALNPSGNIQLYQRVSGTQTQLTSTAPVAVGDRVGVRWVGGLLSAFVNGIEVLKAFTSAVNPNGYARLSAGSSTTGFAVDTLAVDIY